MDVTGDKHSIKKRLYEALAIRDGRTVTELCRQIPEGPLHRLTIHGGSVIHVASYYKLTELVLDLLAGLRDDQAKNMILLNDAGSTMLHDAATSNDMVPAAMEMLRKAPDLLGVRNYNGETALFRAARYGCADMFKFLDNEVDRFLQSRGGEQESSAFYVRDDKTTMLHISVLYEHFDLALLIAQRHEDLIHAQDQDGMTSLQLLACNPSAFPSGLEQGNLKRLFQTCLTAEETYATEPEVSCRVPYWEDLRSENQRCKSAIRLAKFLIEKDTSWEATEPAMDKGKPRIHGYGATSFSNEDKEDIGGGQNMPASQITTLNKPETPLFLATKRGITEIVEEILKRHPLAVEYIDAEGRDILHIAIKYRQMHIFDLIEQMITPMTWLPRKTDQHGNTILHMFGVKTNANKVEDMRSPALLLQEDLLLFERIKKKCRSFQNHRNNIGLTAEDLYALRSTKLRSDAKDWFKRTAENCSIIAVLIATVAFAAAYTVPGGLDEKTGYPVLLSHPFFIIFAMTDVLSLTFALTSVITFLAILTSPFRLKDFKHSLPQKLMLGVTLLIFSVTMMMCAFAATIILMIHNKKEWTRIVMYPVALFPATIFAFSYMPLYVSLMETFEYSLKKLAMFLPHCGNDSGQCWNTNFLRFCRSRSSTSSGYKQSPKPQTQQMPI